MRRHNIAARCFFGKSEIETKKIQFDILFGNLYSLDRKSLAVSLVQGFLKANPEAASGDLAQLLAAMCSLAVIQVATDVLRTELL